MNYLNKMFYWLFKKSYRLLTGLQCGVYIQNFNHVHIGKNVEIGMNTVIIARNHNKIDKNLHDAWRDVIISNDCWIGANCVILSGVELGINTIVGAGSVVTKSFKDGYCVIVGNPAKKIKDIII